ncbi:MAG TPA: VOC family protein [Acidimicrobiia bacterium]|nr:VOC family protein [Acidimicrobiia bacterium]
MVSVKGLDHIVLNVTDVERSLAWYTDELGLDGERVEEWRNGEAPFPSVRVDDTTVIDLIALPRTGENVNHVCLVVDAADLDELVNSDRFEVLQGPVERWGARGVAMSVYLWDPDQNLVELRHYG